MSRRMQHTNGTRPRLTSDGKVREIILRDSIVSSAKSQQRIINMVWWNSEKKGEALRPLPEKSYYSVKL